MTIFFEGFEIKIKLIYYSELYYYWITLPDSNFNFWSCCQPEFDNLSDCLKASMSACLQIIQDYGFGPDFMETDDSWQEDFGAYDAFNF